MAGYGGIWQDMVGYGQIWSDMVRYGEIHQDIAKKSSALGLKGAGRFRARRAARVLFGDQTFPRWFMLSINYLMLHDTTHGGGAGVELSADRSKRVGSGGHGWAFKQFFG